MNARFWVRYKDSWVKLTLRSFAKIELPAQGGRHEEGFNAEIESFGHDGFGVVSEWFSWGRDCDGRYEDGGTAYCPLDQLQARDTDDDVRVMLPEWTVLDRSQRDYTAEAAGY